MQSPFRIWVNWCLFFFGFLFLFTICYLVNFSVDYCKLDRENLINLALERKYVTCTFNLEGGLGNQIWRIASLYGIGRQLGREPYFEIQPQNAKELTNVFPNMMEVLHIKTSPRSTKLVPFAKDCCKYENPIKLSEYSEKFLKVQGNYLQSYKYFDLYKDEIIKLFECGEGVISRVDSSNFAMDERHKICIHTRVGDFVSDKLLESRKEFVEPAVKYVFSKLLERLNPEDIVLGIFGDDKNFMKSLSFSHIPFGKVYGPSERIRMDDFCLASRHCDTFIMTASGSTFAWWIAYLLKNPEAEVYYNAVISDNGNFTKDVHDFDIFPEKWIKITVSQDTGLVFEDDRWWYQRRGVEPDVDQY